MKNLISLCKALTANSKNIIAKRMVVHVMSSVTSSRGFSSTIIVYNRHKYSLLVKDIQTQAFMKCAAHFKLCRCLTQIHTQSCSVTLQAKGVLDPGWKHFEIIAFDSLLALLSWKFDQNSHQLLA